MDSTGIAGNTSATASPVYLQDKQAVRNKQDGMDTNLFMELLVAQMRYPDPFSNSQDTGQMITQLALFTLLEQVIKVQQATERQGYAAEQSGALNLLNRLVEVVDDEGAVFSSPVTAVNFRNQQPYLTVNGQEFPYSSLIKAEGGTSDNG